MAEARVSEAPRRAGRAIDPVTLTRIVLIVLMFAVWEGLARSGLLYRDVVPSWLAIGGAIFQLIADAKFEFFRHLGWTGLEIATALLVGSLSGIAVGIVLGANKLLGRAYEPGLYYLGPTPKIIFLPVLIMWFGIGPESKAALATLSCFFPIALSTAAGMRQINPVLIRVGRSFNAGTWQMVTKIYLPAMRAPIVNGIRLGLGVAIIGTLLAETKLSNKGLGFLVINAYSTFDMPRMYALLILLFVLAIGLNALVGRLGRLDSIQRS